MIDAKEESLLKRSKDTFSAAKMEQQKWLPLWRDLNKRFYPFLYNNLHSSEILSTKPPDKIVNPHLLDGEPAMALLVLASGFNNGVTSPARKWLNVKRPGTKPYRKRDTETSTSHANIRTKILEILSGSNYYECRASQVYDATGLGTSALLCYEDRDTVVKFTLCAPGTYYLVADASNVVVKFCREFRMKASDLLNEFGEDSLPKEIAEKAKAGGSQARTEYIVNHLIEVNSPDEGLRTNHPFRELYWLSAKLSGPCFLAKRPLYEWPVSILRWACPDESLYGIPPTMAVLGKAVQLQNLEYKSDQGLDKLISPPMLAHPSMKNRPKAFGANGITYTNDLGPNSGMRPAYTVQVPFQEIELKRNRIAQSIKDGLFNYLFNQMSELDTVRSATEIDARREERMIVLGPVLHRGYGEDLAVLVKRVFGIMMRKKLVEPPPPEEGAEIEFSNVLSDVQKASDVATLERFTAFVGQVIPAWPEAQPKVDIFSIISQYAEGLGVSPSVLRDDEQAQATMQPAQQMQELQQVSEVAKNFGGAGAGLAKVDVGGGMNAVQSLLS